MIDSLEKCLPAAEKCGVLLGLENHWGLGRTPEGVLRVVNAIKSPWLQVTADTGNFLEDPYDKLEQLAPKTILRAGQDLLRRRPVVRRWNSTTRASPRIFHQQNYRGYVSLEFEGKEDPRTAIPQSLKLLRGAFGSS